MILGDPHEKVSIPGMGCSLQIENCHTRVRLEGFFFPPHPVHHTWYRRWTRRLSPQLSVLTVTDSQEELEEERSPLETWTSEVLGTFFYLACHDLRARLLSPS